MNALLEGIGDWIKEMLINSIMGNFLGMFEDVNIRIGEVAANVGATPMSWNMGVFNLVRTLSEVVIIPVAGMILTFVLCYELISAIIERNNMAHFDHSQIFKWIFKTFVATYLLTHTFDIVMFIFGLAQHVVNASAGVIIGDLSVDFAMTNLATQLELLGPGALMSLLMESLLLRFIMKAVSVAIFCIIYGRMIEIYLAISIAPIPLATMANREWGGIGNNYLKSLFALAFQAFLLMVCLAIYAALLQSVTLPSNLHAAIWSYAGYTILICFTMMKCGSLSKSLFSAH